MRSFSAVIALGAMAFLTCGLRAEESTTGSHSTPAPLLPGIGAQDPRIRVDPGVMPWGAVGKLQAASMNFRALCTATLVGPSTIVTAAHCTFNDRVRRYFSPGALHFLIGYTGSRYAGHAIGTAIKISDGYDPGRPKETVGSDWALVSLDKNLGSEGRVLPILSELPENGAKVARRLSQRSFTRFDGGHSMSHYRTFCRCERPALIEAQLHGDQRHERGAFAYR